MAETGVQPALNLATSGAETLKDFPPSCFSEQHVISPYDQEQWSERRLSSGSVSLQELLDITVSAPTRLQDLIGGKRRECTARSAASVFDRSVIEGDCFVG
jgi:hypothetical protein